MPCYLHTADRGRHRLPLPTEMRAFIARNGLPLNQCLFANVVPWWVRTRAISREQRMLVGQVIAELIGLLPALRAIVLVGRTAQAAWDGAGLQSPCGVRIWRSVHPGPQVRARYPERWMRIPAHWPTYSGLSS